MSELSEVEKDLALQLAHDQFCKEPAMTTPTPQISEPPEQDIGSESGGTREGIPMRDSAPGISEGSGPTPLEKLEAICAEIYRQWDKDQRSGKLLAALAGAPGFYRQDVTDIRAALSAASLVREQAEERDAHDAARYRRLRVLGCAPMNSKWLPQGLVIRFTILDEFIDDDLRVVPSRGEAAAPQSKEEAGHTDNADD